MRSSHPNHDTSEISGTMTPTIAAIIPAFNEQGRLNQVLTVLQHVTEFDEIIVVDDGSTDGTLAEAEWAAKFDSRLRCLHLPVNQGKGAAMFAGAEATDTSILAFFDADLVGLKPDHVRALIKPVIAGQQDMTVGLFYGGQLNTDLAHWLTPWLSGQRCLRAELFGQVAEQAASGYGIETAITLAARRQNWRRQYVPWRGVTHPPTELRRGLKQGVRNRVRMYNEIGKTLRAERRVPFLGRSIWLTLGLVLLALMGSSLAYDQAMASSTLHLADLPALPLAGVQRLLVIAPHPDDETIGAAGAIQAALAAGAQVKVVVITNGDGQAIGPLVFDKEILPHSADYVHDGERRQSETTTALKTLGVPANSILFLGYPDGRLKQLWLKDWTTACPVQAAYTRATASPYPATYDPKATYCGRDLLNDLQTIITDYQPDLILLPHPNDEHPDHRATSSFGLMAVALASTAQPDYAPTVWGYLVHYGRYPRPRGLHPEAALLPPTPLSGASFQWVRLELTPSQMQTKATALNAYTTQMRLMGSFIRSFARQNELFAHIEPLSALAPAAIEPADESSHELVLGSADLIGLQIEQQGELLSITAETEEPLLRGLHYRVQVKLANGKTLTGTWPGSAVRAGKSAFAFTVNLAEIGDPAVLSVAAEVTEGAALDRTGWYIVELSPARP